MSVEPHDPARTKRLLVRGLVAAALLIVAVNAIGYVLDDASGARRGPRSSSYTTSHEGLAGYADLLSRAGHPVERVRSSLAEEPPPPESTLVLLDPGPVDPDAARAVAEFVSAGGRLLTGGTSAPGWIDELVVQPPQWAPAGPVSATVAAPAAEVGGVTEVRASGSGAWADPASGLPVLAGDGSVVATVETAGAGRVVMLADPTLLHNELLASADNAAFGLQAAGEEGRPVLFAESVHGYTAAGGLAAVPDRWLWALTGLFLATLVYMVARGRRLGPPEDAARPLPPPRRDYADALGGIHARTRDASAVANKLRAAIRRRVAARAGLGADASDAEIARAAHGLGMSQRQLGALERAQATEEELLVLGRALASLEGEAKRRNEGIGVGL